MFRAGVGASEFYGETAADRARGGLQYSSSSSDDEMEVGEDGAEEDVVPMEEEEGDNVNETDFPPLIIPAPLPTCIVRNAAGTQFHFNRARIPRTCKGVAPHVMKGAAAIKEETAKQKAGIYLHNIAPGPVHASPMVSLMQVMGLDASKELGCPLPLSNAYTGTIQSIYLLQQLKMACVYGTIPFHASITPEALQERCAEYAIELRRIGAAQEEQLDALYATARVDAPPSLDQVMADFMFILESYTLKYIHLLEHFLWRCLIEPHNGIATEGTPLPVECVLTPNVFPSLGECHTSAVRDPILRDMKEFFQHKDSVCRAKDAVDANPLARIQWEALTPSRRIRDPNLYKGYMPHTTVREYLLFLDCDGVLSASGVGANIH
jgi:hypothetical protein